MNFDILCFWLGLLIGTIIMGVSNIIVIYSNDIKKAIAKRKKNKYIKISIPKDDREIIDILEKLLKK